MHVCGCQFLRQKVLCYENVAFIGLAQLFSDVNPDGEGKATDKYEIQPRRERMAESGKK